MGAGKGRARRMQRPFYNSTGLHGTSQIEIQLRHEVGEFFKTEHDKKLRVFLSGNGYRYDADIVLPDEKIVIEYDSFRYHGSPEKEAVDRRKNKILEKAGYSVIRARQHPLQKLGSNDVVFPNRAKLHAVAVTVLERIKDVLRERREEVTQSTSRKIEKYSREGVALASRQADMEIDKIRQSNSPDTRASKIGRASYRERV